MHLPLRLAHLTPLAAALLLLGACSSIENSLSGDRVDYRAARANSAPIDVPPDLTQLVKDPRYTPPSSGSVSASEYQATAPALTGTAAAAAATPIAPSSAGDLRIERAGNERWLSTAETPEQLWPKLRKFWQDRGLALELDQPQAGVMETVWAENRAKLPQDIIRRTVGRVFDSLYSTGEQDKYRTRVERTPTGSEIYISHRGMEEVYTSQQKDSTVWQPRASDPQMEAEMLTRLMTDLAPKPADGTAAVPSTGAVAAAAAAAPARARVLEGQPGATLQLDDNFDRAWRRVGLALDRSGFTVEDRDRNGGTYYVRYADPAKVGKGESGFFGRLFGGNTAATPERYRIAVRGAGEATTVAVLNAQGAPEPGPVGQRIVTLLVEDLR